MNVLEEVFGEADNLKLVGLFYENPFDVFSYERLLATLPIGESRMARLLDDLTKKGFVVREDAGYRWEFRHPLSKGIQSAVDALGMALLQERE